MSSKSFVFFSVIISLSFLGLGCTAALADAEEVHEGTKDTKNISGLDVVYSDGLAKGWNDYGWAPRELKEGEPAKINFSNYGGWQVSAQALSEDAHRRYESLRFELKAPRDFGDFLELRLSAEGGGDFPAVVVSLEKYKTNATGFRQISVSMDELNPNAQPFKILRFRARQKVSTEEVYLNTIVFWGQVKEKKDADTNTKDSTPKSRRKEFATAPVAKVWVDFKKESHTIPEEIFGIAFNARLEHLDTHIWELNPGARRFGGNVIERYNWKMGNAWNTANDWYFLNVNFSQKKDFHWSHFFRDNEEHGVLTALSVSMLGWVAKDLTSYSFPVASFGPQQSTAPSHPDAGNGRHADGSKMVPGPPTRTSEPMPPKSVGYWLREVLARQKREKADSLTYVMLGNEPMIWHETHRDIQKKGLGYDELWEKSRNLARAIRDESEDVKIVGPNVWGWPAYLYSAKDMEFGPRLRPDRRAHGDLPLLAWYLKKMAAYEKLHQVRLLDQLGVHFYPQGKGIFTNGRDKTDSATASARVRSVRALWDPKYTDESWIDDEVKLFPRLKAWIDTYYPGLKISLGEYSFGGEHHISGAIALAEALGRMTQEPTLGAAYYWTYPPKNSPAYWAFRAFRNFDGRGGKFLERSVRTKHDKMVSIFASQSGTSRAATLIFVNKDRHSSYRSQAALRHCSSPKLRSSRRWDDEAQGLVVDTDVSLTPKGLEVLMKPWSIHVVELGC